MTEGDWSTAKPISPAAPSRVDDLAAFRALLLAATPRVWLVWVFLGASIAMFLATVISSGNIASPNPEDLIVWGANYGPRTLRGESWRLLSGAFLHVSMLHLALNMLVLASIGVLIERIFGQTRFAAVYLTAAVTGGLASLVIHRQMIAVGASGAIFGLYGALAAFLLRQRGVMPSALISKLTKTALGFVAYNLTFGLLVPGIDNACHIGGLVGGFVAGLLLTQPLTAKRQAGIDALLAASVLFGTGTIALVEVTALAAPADFMAELTHLRTMEEASLAEYNALVEKAHKQQIDDDSFAGRLETSIVPGWRDERARLTQGSWPEPTEKLRALLVRYTETRERAFTEFAKAMRSHDPAAVKAAQDIQTDAVNVALSIKGWKP